MSPNVSTSGEHRVWMQRCLSLAQDAALKYNEVPIACLIVKGDRVIAEAVNDRERTQDPLGHAELRAIQTAAQKLKIWRLEDCTLYVTLEPCPMCAGAILQARIPMVVYGAKDPKAGADGSVVDVLKGKGFNHQPEIVAGVLGEECAKLLSEFFKGMR
jgi:tRNA(adenine34) deaminase